MGIIVVIILEQLVPINSIFQLRDSCGQWLQSFWNIEHSSLTLHHTFEYMNAIVLCRTSVSKNSVVL